MVYKLIYIIDNYINYQMSKLTKLNILNKDIRGIINKYLLPHKKSLDLKELEDSIYKINIVLDLYYKYEMEDSDTKYKKIKNEWILVDGF
jgi:hypothetical protein